MKRWLRLWWCRRQLKGAVHDEAYFRKEVQLAYREVERCKKNVEVAQDRQKFWRRQHLDAEYPIGRVVLPRSVIRR